MPTLTAAQIWYITQLYPERVSEQQAQEAFSKAGLDHDDTSYWIAAANVLNALFDKPEGQSGKRFTLTFSMENDDFNTGSPSSAIMAILDQVRGSVATGRYTGATVDRNGNTVGLFCATWRRNPEPTEKPRTRRKPRPS
jgi:hypothetical protein